MFRRLLFAVETFSMPNFVKRASLWSSLVSGCVLFAGAGLALSGNRAHAETTPPVPATAPADRLIKSVQQYWELTPEQKSRPQPFELQCHVTFFDPEWKMLFIQDMAGTGAYVPYGHSPYPFKAGDRIIASGTLVPPNADINFENATIHAGGQAWPKPLDISGKAAEFGRFITKFVRIDGFVDSYRRLDGRHVQLHLSVEGMPIVAWLLISDANPTPDLTDAIVRVEGVYNPKIGPDGNLTALEIMVPDLAHLTVLHRLENDPRFKLPTVTIGSLPQLPAGEMVRVVGQVKAQEPGRFVRIRDDTGQVDILTGQNRPHGLNNWVEAVGFPRTEGTEWQLARGLLRNVASAASDRPAGKARESAAEPEILRLAARVLELSPEEAMKNQPVWLTGVVTWSSPDSPFFFIQDSSAGICVLRDQSTSQVRSPGRNMEVHGVTAMGQFAPVVKASRFDKLSDMVLPVARQTSLEHALTGAEEAQWVEMRGYLRQIHRQDGWNHLEIATSAGDFIAVLPATADLSAMIGAVVRLHGVCTAKANEQRKLTGIKLWVPSADYVQVEEAAPKDPFDVPARSLASLGQFGSLHSFSRRLRVSGVVLHHAPGHLIHLQEGNDSLLVFSREQTPLRPGDRIEAVGFLGRQAGRVALQEAVYRKTGTGEQPMPHPILVEKIPTVTEDGRLVSVEGLLIENSRAGNLVRLTLQTENAIFEAILDPARADEALTRIVNGSRLALTGVYEVKYDEYGQPVTFQLHLRSPADVTVRQSPSWWTRGRILGFTGALAFGTLLFIAWIWALRRQVHEQTEQIRQQVKRESQLQAELQRASKLESLGLLAGGIAHDFNNLLTVVMGNLSLARLDAPEDSPATASLHDAEKAVVRARDLTQQLLTFAKGGAPIRTAVSLPEIVREVAEFALRGSNTRCQFDIPPDLWPANVDKGQIGQVVQNIAINAMHAMPKGGILDISLKNETVGPELAQVLTPGRYILITMTDHGSGIRPEDLQQIFDPYFTTKKHGSGLGLATVHSIVKKHLGHISAESTPGQGTTFHIWLPAAEAAPGPADVPDRTAPLSAATGSARILFMDDEETIRRLGASILGRVGYDVKTVNDGAEAVREYAAAREAGQPFALVILDLTIPGGMGGRQAVEQLRKLDPDVKAIVSSGYSNDLVLSNYQAHGFQGMVSKPYEIADLVLTVERVLKGERA
jgi:signal transduction histidine kinase/ActR/RegA family two-component response regulator